MPETHYHIEIESDPNNLITVEEFVNYFAKDLGLNEEQLATLLLAVTEATTNAIIHANKSNQSKLVKVDVKVENSKLIIKVIDEGKGFNPSEIPDPTQPENILKDSGRGMYLMKVYMDDLKYNVTSEGTETILTMNI
ncbi:MAG: ATP-binding protein [Ignavibacteria bacterium]|nr:ATP-binding protein [Ignavibacteria bacterium]MBT8382230.1 ATP-binding protein [Ignavibacteria bacterium]MBT8390166.1 ATP-binding protein [Ignavibacteria bacterium]NNJ52763.1 ATP-binding protein [Ignavibacteriaceae bacterium]NNL20345.1 ATP-binding protein [Ignavibacteriaceae bacterium]